ncbi:MAG: hypothetical protein AAB728_06290, partial [Patescibacteria group bacterium]
MNYGEGDYSANLVVNYPVPAGRGSRRRGKKGSCEIRLRGQPPVFSLAAPTYRASLLPRQPL